MQKLFIVCGIPFSGKSVFSKRFAMLQGLTRIDLDEIKFELLGNLLDEVITQDQWDHIYQEMYRRIEQRLSEGRSVVQDAGNFTQYERGLIRNIAKKLGIESIVIFVNTPEKVARARWKANQSSDERFQVSEADLDSTIKEMEPPANSETHVIYRGEPVEKWIQNVV